MLTVILAVLLVLALLGAFGFDGRYRAPGISLSGLLLIALVVALIA